jgi:hypothetical protein
MLNVAFLTRTQRMIEQHDVGFIRGYRIANLFQLALTDEKSRAGLFAGPGNGADRFNTSRCYQFAEFTGVFGAIVGSKIDVDEYRALTDIRTFKQLASTPGQSDYECHKNKHPRPQDPSSGPYGARVARPGSG